MKKIFFCFVFLKMSTAFTQNGVGIGTGNVSINSNAVVDMSKSNKGLLIPRLTEIGRIDINSPAEGLMVYDSTLHRTYQFQDGVWQYLLDNAHWSKSTSTKKYTFSMDSVGIGTSTPDARLEVNGNIRTRSALLADDDVIAGKILKGSNLTATGNIFMSGRATVAGDIRTESSVIVDNVNPIVQLKDGNTNKGFIETSGNDFHLGTSPGNKSGKTIIRMNGTDLISIDTSSNFKVLTGGAGGNLHMNSKITRLLSPDENMLPILFGKVYGNSSQAWMSTDNGTILNTGPGIYTIKTYSARFSARASVLVTVAGELPLVASAVHIAETGTGYNFMVVIINPLTQTYTNADFNFIVSDPMNIFN